MEKNYDIWVPAYTGEKPPLWLVGMHWAVAPEAPDERDNDPAWISGTEYTVPLLALPPQAAQHVGGVTDERVAKLEAEIARLRSILGSLAADAYAALGEETVQ